MNLIDKDFIEKVEKAYFRTDEDTGANWNALFVWNRVRDHVGLSQLRKEDLPAYCQIHRTYHVINKDYGCERKAKEG